MLNFLRKYQKYFFFVIAGAVIVSFCFFGTYNGIGERESIPDKEIAKGVCGRPLMQREWQTLTSLIAHSPFDSAIQERGILPNLLNDGVIEKEFLSTGLAIVLATKYFDEIKPDFETRLKKIQSFRPYVHPHSKEVSAEGVWTRFSPRLLEKFHLLQRKSKDLTSETFALMCQLYVEQAMLPSDVLKQILAMQQGQLGAASDPFLPNADLNLFGFKSMEEWFGPRFLSLVAQFILNSAQLAEEKGYKISHSEIRSDLFRNIVTGYQGISRNSQLSSEEAERYYNMKMRMLALEEATVLRTWEKVMLFRKLFEEGSASVFIDALAYRQFEDFAKENVRISLYQLPSHLRFADFGAMLKFQCYLEGIAPEANRLRSDLRLPKQLCSIEAIEKKIPELVERPMELEWSAVSKEDLAKTISVKETWEWESIDPHWEQLKRNFPEIQQLKGETPQQRLLALDRIDEKLRNKIDRFARMKMIEEHPEKVKIALQKAEKVQCSLSLKTKGTLFPIPHLQESAELKSLLENASLKGETPNSAQQRLNFYTQGDTFYSVQVIQRASEKKVLSFPEASKDGTLDRLLDKKLEDAYSEVRKKDSKQFQLSNGEWKPFKQVRDQIGKVLFADLLKTIEEDYRSHFGFLPGKEGELPLHFYSNARLLTFMAQAQTALRENPQDSVWLKTEKVQEGICAEWLLENEEKNVQRCTPIPFSKEEMFTLAVDEWSPVKMGERGSLAFYFIRGKEAENSAPIANVEQGHQILSFDARKDMMLQVLQRIQQKKAIDVSLLIAGEQ